MPGFRSLAFVLAIGLTLATAGVARAQGVLYRSHDGDPGSLDPLRTTSVAEAHLLRDLYEGLVIHTMKGEIAPGVAESWTTSEDGLVWRFTLRRDARWSNGEPVTASDFVFSLRRMVDPRHGAPYAPLLDPILNAERIQKAAEDVRVEDLGVLALGPGLLEIRLERPTAHLLELLAHQATLPVYPATADRPGRMAARVADWVSNGPYVLKDFVPSSHIRLDRNPTFHAAADVRIETVISYPIPDAAVAARRFLAGELHLTTDIATDQIAALRGRLGAQLSVSPALGTYFLVLNTAKAPYSDARLRRALSLAIDREFIAERVWAGTMLPAYGVIPPHIGNYGERAELDFKAASPLEREDEAKRLMAAAGYGPGMPLRLELRYNRSDNNRRTIAAIAEQWAAIGVETSLVETDSAAHFAHLREGGEFDVARYGWIGDYSDPLSFLFLFRSDNTGFNVGRYADPQFDALLKLAAGEADLARRAAILREADSLIVRDQPWIPVLHYSHKNLVSSRLAGFAPNPQGAIPSRFLSFRP
ncbi:MAG: ABC transporter substrate-binding protein [Bosea sp. 32-68-6]|nr:MAG: ABC transporter substrate-binding protein [Bosea sp. 32-68-6]